MDTTAKTTTVADELRTAAATLREAAKEATRGPWVKHGTLGDRQNDGHAWTITRPYCDKGAPDGCEPDCIANVLTTGAEGCEEDNLREADAAWICLANPLLAEPLATALEHAAKEYEHFGTRSDWTDCPTAASLLPVARTINGGAA
ncbi:hypothetical protein ABZ912_19815 [Nonomuraea angiospora]|uniref:hypothetical protein n=1 Tax=Nonomuraea angiospora TaxID=46172 RepID=UPI0033E2FDF0